jgi:hypothetical protein
MNIVKRNLSDLKRPEKNMRLHPEKQMQEYIRSVKKNGQLKLIVIDEDNVIWIGNGLYEAMLACGYMEAYCLLKDNMSDKDKKKMMMSDNRVFDLGVDDMAAFDALIAELGDDLDVPGFDEELLKSLIADADDIDNMMSEYGLVDEDKKAEIVAAKETYDKQAEAFANAPQENSAPTETQRVKVNAENREQQKHIICPKCGEKIWL